MLPAILLVIQAVVSAPSPVSSYRQRVEPPAANPFNGRAHDEFQKEVRLSLERSRNSLALADTVAKWVQAAASAWMLEIVLAETSHLMKEWECDLPQQRAWNRALARMAKAQKFSLYREAFKQSPWGEQMPWMDFEKRSFRPKMPIQFQFKGSRVDRFARMNSIPIELSRVKNFPSDSALAEIVDTVWAKPTGNGRSDWKLDSLLPEGLWRLSVALDDVFCEGFLLVSSIDGVLVRDGTRYALWGSSFVDKLSAPFEVLSQLSSGEWRSDSTDGNGLKVYHAEPGRFRQPEKMLLRKDGHMAMLLFPNPYENLENAKRTASIWTDRPIYRPGDTVRLMGILLERNTNGDLTQFHPDSVHLEIHSLAGAAKRRLWLRVGKDGQFSGKFRLDPDERQGRLGVSAVAFLPRPVPMEDSYCSFEVQAYRRPEFEVRMATSDSTALRGDSVRLTVEANYLHGSPLNNARVKLSIQKIRGLFDGNRKGQERIRDTALAMGGDGKVVVPIPTAFLEPWESIRVQAVVEDVSRRSETASLDIPVWPTALRIEAHFLTKSVRVGSAARVALKVINRNGEPTVGSVLLRHLLGTEVLQEIQRKTDSAGLCTLTVIPRSGRSQYISVAASVTENDPVFMQSIDLPWIAEKGADAEFWADRAIASVGDTLRLVARGLPPSRRLWFVSEGRRLDTFYVAKSDSLGRWTAKWRVGPAMRPKGRIKVFFDTDDGMEELSQELIIREAHRILRADIQVESVVRPSDTLVAKIKIRDMVGKGVQGRFSLAIIDNSLWKLVSPASPDGRWERSIPLSELDLCLGWQGAYSEMSNRSVGFSCGGQVQSIGSKFPRTFGKIPRGCATLEKRSAPENYFDEILKHEGQRSPRPQVDGDRMAGVGGIGLGWASREGSTGKTNEVSGEPDLSSSMPEEVGYPDPEELVQPSRIRVDFRELAYWSDSIATDSAGGAVVKVVLPDDLTRWRLVLRGADGGARVVDAQEFVSTRRDLIVKLQTPRFLVEGDTSRIATEVHNLSTQSRSVVVAVEAKDSLVRFLGPKSTRKSMAGGSTISPEWTLVADSAGSALLGAQAKASDDADALERSIPVSVHGVPRVQAQSGILRTPLDSERLVGHAFGQDLFPKTALARGRAVRLEVSASLAPGLLGPLGYLTGYPYGCVEQTLSRFVPNLAVASALRRSGMHLDTLDANLPKWTDAGLNGLAQMQNADGGWGWWTEKSSDPRLTVLVMEGLALALEEAGKHRENAWGERVRRIRQLMAKGRGSLQGYVESPSVSRGLRIRGLRVLATGPERPDEAWIAKRSEKMWSNRKGVDASTYADFLEIAHVLKRTPMENEATRAIWSRSISDSVVDGRTEPGIHWTGIHGWDGQGDSLEVTASVLRALLRTSHADGRTGKIVSWISAQRRGEGWGSTRATAKVVEALALALESMNESKTRGVAHILAGNRKIASFAVVFGNLANANASATFRDSIPSNLHVTFSGTGHVYWTLDTRWTEGGAYLKSCSTSLAVRRSYRKVVPFRLAGGVPSESTVPFDGNLESGEQLEVRIELDSKSPVGHLMLEDPFPAGTEVVRESMGQNRSYWWGFQATHQEARDDRMVWFLAEKPAGTAAFTYRLRAERPGTYHALPARAELMYRPEVQANSDETIVRIEGK